jgi:hypothetical protein
MSSHEWQQVYQAIRDVSKSVPNMGRKRPVYDDVLIVAMYVWAVWHDRPLCWAADRRNYTSVFRPRHLPSRSQFCRRIKTARCEAILQGMHERLARVNEPTEVSFIDGRPFPVGPYTTDGDAGIGWDSGRLGKGYKLHAFATKDGRITHFRVEPLNVSEKGVARLLLAEVQPKGLVLADGNYDAGVLYDLVAESGGQLFTPLPKNVGGGHRQQSQARLRAASLWRRCGKKLYRRRTAIERFFSQLSSFGGGLAPLPAWVRTLPRVRRWISIKLMIYHARLATRRNAA